MYGYWAQQLAELIVDLLDSPAAKLNSTTF